MEIGNKFPHISHACICNVDPTWPTKGPFNEVDVGVECNMLTWQTALNKTSINLDLYEAFHTKLFQITLGNNVSWDNHHNP